jgi:hypothetical protein
LDAAQNQLARGTTLAGGGFAQVAMQPARDIDAGADVLGAAHDASMALAT